MHKYRLISKKGEGTFSEVLKAQSIKSGKYTAIKCMKNHFDSIDQVNNLREVQALRRLAGHPHIIKLHEVLYDEPTGRLALVFELMDMNLYEAIKGRRHYLPEQTMKKYMYAMLKALDHMHRNGIFHRDVKPENLLLLDDEIKLADLGSCRGIYSRQPYTEYISTRWYRAPECLLTDGYYNFKMDLFAAGCVWFEIVALFPLFPGQNEMDQIQKIHNVLGTPSPDLLSRKFKRNASHMDFNFPEKKGQGIERLIPHAGPELVELLKKLVRYDPDERIIARQALKDPYFRELRDAEKERGSTPGTGGGSGSSANHEAGAASQASNGGTKSVGMSASSSTASIAVSDGGSEAGQASRAESPTWQERSGVLPNIKKDDAGGREDRDRAPEDGTVLPPIGAARGGKRDSKPGASESSKSKMRAFRNSTLQNAASTSLQKPNNVGVAGHGHPGGHPSVGGHGNHAASGSQALGPNGLAISGPVSGAMSTTLSSHHGAHPHSLHSQHHAMASTYHSLSPSHGSNAAAQANPNGGWRAMGGHNQVGGNLGSEKMNSTWAPKR